MKKIVMLGLLFGTLHAVENEMFSLTAEVKTFARDHSKKIKESDLHKVTNLFNRYDDLKVIKQYHLIALRFDLVAQFAASIVEVNKGWSYIKHFNLEREKIELVKKNKAAGLPDKHLDPEYNQLFAARLDESSEAERNKIESNAIKEAFAILAQVID